MGKQSINEKDNTGFMSVQVAQKTINAVKQQVMRTFKNISPQKIYAFRSYGTIYLLKSLTLRGNKKWAFVSLHDSESWASGFQRTMENAIKTVDCPVNPVKIFKTQKQFLKWATDCTGCGEAPRTSPDAIKKTQQTEIKKAIRQEIFKMLKKMETTHISNLIKEYE